MKKTCIAFIVILYVLTGSSYCWTTADKITPEPPAISTYEPVAVYSNPETIHIADAFVVEALIEEVEPRYGFTDDEVYLLAQLLCGSATVSGDGEYDFVWQGKVTNYSEMCKVLCVVMNRVRSDKFPNTVTDVVLQKGQFSNVKRSITKTPDDLAIKTIQAWCDAYDNWDIGVQNIPESHLYFGAGPNLTNVTREKY